MKAHGAELDMSKGVNVTEDIQKLLAKEQSAIMYPGIATSFHMYWLWMGNAGWFRLLGSVGPAAPVDTLMHIWYDRSKDNRPGSARRVRAVRQSISAIGEAWYARKSNRPEPTGLPA